MAERPSRPASVKASPGANPERVPPHSDEAERGLLGCILMDSARVLDQCGVQRVQAECFYQPRHQALFEILSDMNERRCKVDLLTAVSRLKDLGRLDEVGGESFLLELVDGVPTVEHAGYYIEIILQKYVLRTILDRARQMSEECFKAEEDAMEILGRAEQMVLDIGRLQTEEGRPWPELVKHAVGEIDDILKNPGEITGLSTGYRGLDKVLLGMQRGDMIILAARPSMGKTSLAMNIVEHVAFGVNEDTRYAPSNARPTPVAVFSLEMSRESLVRRMLCSRAGISWGQVVDGFPDDTYFPRVTNAASHLMRAPILVDDTAGLNVLELRARARRMHKMNNIGLIVVDYLQMLNYPQLSKEGRQRETQAISGALKAMAKELRVPVLVLSQLNRQPETRDKKGVPRLSDLRDSGSIEQDADVVLLLRRPCKNRDDPKYNELEQKLAVVDVAKQRNGRTGEIDMVFEEEFTRFRDHAPRGTDEDVAIDPSSGGLD